MSISPPSDIILDVARAADPVREQRAVARLSQTAAPEGESFDRILNAGATESAAAKPVPPPDPRPVARAPAGPAPIGTSDSGKAFRGFEAMALASMIEAALPKEDDTIFGSGTAGRAWKSMLAEQLGVQMAEAGGIGIAKQLASEARFGRGPDDPGRNDTASIAESLVVAQIERGFVDAVMPDAIRRDEEWSS